ncbi:MAG: GNAT family N-acetyltransferase [Pseudomonadota bacterium]
MGGGRASLTGDEGGGPAGIETARLRLRRWRAEDAPALEAILGDPKVMRFSDDGPLGPQARAAWLRAALAEAGRPAPLGAWAITRKPEAAAVGYLKLAEDGRIGPNDVELGVRLALSAQGRGFASEAARAAVEALAASVPSVRLVAVVDPGNLASVRLMARLGLVRERDVMFEGYDHPDHLYVAPS